MYTQILDKFKKTRLSFLIYILALLLPSIIISADGFSKALYPLLFLIGLVSHYRYFFWITLPFYLLSPFIIYYEIIYDTPPDITLWFTLLGSSQTEASAYMSSLNLPLLIALILGYIILFIFFYRSLPEGKINLPLPLRIFFLCLILIPVIRTVKADGDSQQRYLNLYRHYKQSYPMNLLMGYPAAQMEVDKIKSFIKDQDDIQCSLHTKTKEPQTIVVVIGESARKDRLSLYGYTANKTTPYLEKIRSELWIFEDMISAAFITSRSVPAILTGKIDDSDHLFPSFLNAYNAAGYKTYWLSAQAKFGEFDSLVSAYAQSAQNTKFLNQHSYSTSLHDFYDEELLPDFNQALKKNPKQNKLIVLHLYGSHADFSRRYPATFDKLNNSYDNSIRYTDFILSQVIEQLKKQNGVSTLLYTSDHGVNLGQCTDNPSGHLDMKTNYQVPLIMWASSAWKHQYPDMAQQLNQVKSTPLSAKNLMPTLLDLGHIECPTLSTDLSLFSSKPSQHTRHVLTLNKIVNYDESEDDDECHLIEKNIN